jgi:hypothetical protein
MQSLPSQAPQISQKAEDDASDAKLRWDSDSDVLNQREVSLMDWYWVRRALPLISCCHTICIPLKACCLGDFIRHAGACPRPMAPRLCHPGLQRSRVGVASVGALAVGLGFRCVVTAEH